MSKYSRLRKFLSLHRDDRITLTPEQIELIINDKLPPSARKHGPWWYSPFHHPHVRNWTDIGWTVKVHREERTTKWVTFRKP